MTKTNTLINVIAGKLDSEELTKQNYSKDKAVRILNECVSKTKLIAVLDEYEKEIIQLLE